MKNLLNDNEEIRCDAVAIDEKIEEIEETVQNLKEQNFSILQSGAFNDLEKVDQLTRNRTRIELAPVALEIAKKEKGELRFRVHRAMRRAREALQPYYSEIEEILNPRIRQILVDTMGEEAVQGVNGAERRHYRETKIYKESIYPNSRLRLEILAEDSHLSPSDLDAVDEEINRVLELHKELTKEAKKSA
ncbi:hypothetical protein DDZ13_07360 [Coraliomargarita sinensis]|uniref:Uncharacterized protein n=1 Tax=Coraliomargarita sinensis TaxID=2174842 RepID=A0A317ZHB5_9BACT|nr:hypothetical protein [Coraliomargarita sinensis]PXA04342.1 hypothetical protein DDZ13_07360 [Coraliomargarita sinensis]